MSNAIRRLVPSQAVIALSACLALASPVDARDDELRPEQEFEFARGLAEDWQFIDIATEILDRVENGKLDAKQRAELALTRCQVFGVGARFEPDPARREALFVDALEGYDGFLGTYGKDPDPRVQALVQEAGAGYVDLGAAYISAMETALEDAVGAEAERIRTDLGERVRDLLDFANRQVDALANEPTRRDEYGRQLLYKAQIGLAGYRLFQGQQADYIWFDTIGDSVDQISLVFGDLSGYGLSSYVILGDAYAVQGEYFDAASFYEFVIEQTIPTDVEAWLRWLDETRPGRARLDGLWYFVELATPKWIEALEAAGQPEAAMRAALHYHNTWRREGFNLSARGHLGLLAVARTFLDAGGFLGGEPDALAYFDTFEAARDAGVAARRIRPTAEVALELASFTNEENQGNTLQIRAQRLIADAIGRPGVEVGIETLFEAAKGYYNAQDYPAAVDAFRGVLANISDEADARLYTPRILYHIGRSFTFQERHLEAAMAYREALVEWQGDAEYDEQNASGFYNSMRRLRRDLKDDPRIEELYRESEVLMSSLGSDPGTIAYRQGTRDFDAGDYESARASFQSVEPAAPVYEKALVKAARCLYELGSLDQAVAELDAYLEGYVQDPKNRLGATDAGARAQRDEAMAEAAFYKGQILRDQGELEGMLELYATFPARFGSQPDLVAAALYYCVDAALQLDDVDRAIAFHEQLVENHPDNDFTGNGATLIFNAVKDRYEVAEQSGDAATAREMLAAMATYAEVSNQLRDRPEFGPLLTEARLWRDLGNWEKAEEDFSRLLKLFGDTADSREQRLLERSVKPDLGAALLELRRVPEAFAIVAPLVPDPEADVAEAPTQQTVEVYCRSVAGWVLGDPSNPTIVPGVGGAENFAKAGPWWRKLSNAYEKWLDCAWYDAEFSRAWTYYQWGKEDSAKTQVAAEILGVIRSETGATFDYVQENCDDDPRLRNLFRWLSTQL